MSCTYNSVTFTYPLTNIHIMGPIADPSHSDQLYTEIKLGVESLLNVALLPADITTDATPADVLTRIRHKLTKPRAAFYYDLTSLPGQVGASPIINIPDGRDDGTGPWPDAAGFVVSYTTSDTLLVKWSCTIRIRDCAKTSQGGTVATAPLSLRWKDSLSWDSSWKATYRREGTIILSSRSFQTMDWFRRNQLAPPIPFGFRRISSNYTISADFLRCDFTMVDEQIRFAPPYPGVAMTITQSETAPISEIRKGQVAVTIAGIQNANVVDLSRWALIIMAARVTVAGPLAAGPAGAVALLGVINLETRESEGDVSVTASCSYKTNPNARRLVGVLGGRPWGALTGPGMAGVPALRGRLTPEGRAVGVPGFPWVGVGTSIPSEDNPVGYAVWANPTAAIGGPADGVGLAQAVSLFGALLMDPCAGG